METFIETAFYQPPSLSDREAGRLKSFCGDHSRSVTQRQVSTGLGVHVSLVEGKAQIKEGSKYDCISNQLADD